MAKPKDQPAVLERLDEENAKMGTSWNFGTSGGLDLWLLQRFWPSNYARWPLWKKLLLGAVGLAVIIGSALLHSFKGS